MRQDEIVQIAGIEISASKERTNLMTKCVIVGFGRIGKEVLEQARKAGYKDVAWFTSTGVSGQFNYGSTQYEKGTPEQVANGIKRVCSEHDVRIAFVAIPSSGDGAMELAIMQAFIAHDVRIVVAGKASLSQRFRDLEPHIDMIGSDAAVGGGTGVLPSIEQNILPLDPSPITLKGVFNGTMNYILSGRWRRRPMDALLWEAQQLGYAESTFGTHNVALRLFCDELADVRKKTVIVINRTLRRRLGTILVPDDIQHVPLTEESLESYVCEGARCKYVVQVSTESMRFPGSEDAPGSLRLDTPELHVRAGFCHVPADSALDKWLPDGVGNAVEISQGGSHVLVSGEGAGPVTTARRMILNAHRLMQACR
ncbi:MAG: hypothetical protein Q7R65_01190 [bacterium]|nr:hypothetical protein [bacterium]